MTPPSLISAITRLLVGRIARGSALSLLIRVSAMCLGFLQAVLLARLLGPTGYGVFALTLSVTTLVGTASLMGLGNSAVREVSRLRARGQVDALRGFIQWSAVVVLAVSALGGASISGVSMITSMGLPLEFVWAAALTPLIGMLLLLRGVLQGFGNVFGALVPTEFVRPMTMVVILSATIFFTLPITIADAIASLIAANLIALSIAAVALFTALSRSAPAERPMFSTSHWILEAAPFFAISMLLTLQAEANTLLLGWLSGPREAGLFQPVLRIASVMLIARQAVDVPLTPRVSELWEDGDVAHLIRIVGQATLVTTVATVLICGALLLLAPWLLSAFGSAFTSSIPALAWLAAAQILNAACGPVGNLLNMTGHQIRTASSLFVALIVNFALGIWLIPQHGAYGAAITMAVSICVWNLLMLREVKLRLGIDPSIVGVVRRIGW